MHVIEPGAKTDSIPSLNRSIPLPTGKMRTGVDGGRLEWGAEWSGKGTTVGHLNMNEFSVFHKEISHHLVRTFDSSK
jgi:hypothetical protein